LNNLFKNRTRVKIHKESSKKKEEVDFHIE